MNANVKKTTARIAIVAVGVAAITVGVGALAASSDPQSRPDNPHAAGTLEFGESTDVAVHLGYFAPGGAAMTRTLIYTNTSASLSGKVTLDFVLANPAENGCDEDEVTYDTTCATPESLGELQDKLQVTVSGGGTMNLYSGPLSGLDTVSAPDVAPGDSVTYTLTFRFPNVGPADNAAQGDTVTLQTTATLAQPTGS